MPGVSGFDVVAQMQPDRLPITAFVTAYDAYVVEAFKVHAVDYLLKRIEGERLASTVARAQEYR